MREEIYWTKSIEIKIKTWISKPIINMNNKLKNILSTFKFRYNMFKLVATLGTGYFVGDMLSIYVRNRKLKLNKSDLIPDNNVESK